MWIAEPPPDHQSLDERGQSPNKIGILCSGGSTRGYFSLSLLNFLVNLMIFLFIRCSNDVGEGHFFAFHFALDSDIHVHVIE
jgi:hypothetical protein